MPQSMYGKGEGSSLVLRLRPNAAKQIHILKKKKSKDEGRRYKRGLRREEEVS